MPLSHQSGSGGKTGGPAAAGISRSAGVSKPPKNVRRQALDDVTNDAARRAPPSALPTLKDSRAKRDKPQSQPPPKSSQLRTTVVPRTRLADKAAANAARRAGAATPRVQATSVHFMPRPTPARKRLLTQPAEPRRDASDAQVEKARLETEELRKKAEVNESMAKSLQELRQLFLDSKSEDSSKVEFLAAKLAEKELAIASVEAELIDKRAKLNAADIDLAKERHSSEMAKSELEAKLELAAARSGTLEQQMKTLEATVAALKIEKESTEKSLSGLREELKDRSTAVADHDVIVARMRAESERVSEALARSEASKLHLEKQLDEASSLAREHMQTMNKMELDSMKAKTDVRRLETMCAELTSEMESIKSSLDTERREALCLKEEIIRVRKDAEERARDLESQLQVSKKECVSLTETMEAKVKGAELEKRKAQASEDETRVELNSAKSDCAQFRATISSQEGALTAMKSQLCAVEIKLSAQGDLCVEKTAEIEALRATVESYLADIRKLEEQAHTDENERRRLHNALQELKGNIRVFCRVRPTLPRDGMEDETPVFSYHNKSRGITACVPSPEESRQGAKKAFTFDRVFGPTSTQEDVFGEISQLVQSALDGYRVCIFAYGQTGSGKTHTIMGDSKHLGMIPRSVEQVFARAERLKQDQWTFQFKASFLEIYNEKVRDLLSSNQKPIRTASGHGAPPNGGRAKKEEYEIVYNRSLNECSVEGLTVSEVSSPQAAVRLIETAAKHRATAATLSNAESSRSHSVFRLYISGHNASSDQRLRGVLNLVDLAGSERIKISGAEGDRLRETKAINKSLTQLSIVIQSLANKDTHIPYRNSKLTKLLQDSLGGDSKCLMFVNVSPTPGSYNESLCSLRFAEQVNACDIGTAKRATKISLIPDA